MTHWATLCNYKGVDKQTNRETEETPMSVVEQVELLNHVENTALSIVPLWAVLYLGLHILRVRGNKLQPTPVPAPIVTPGPLVGSLRVSRVTPAPKPELIPEPQPEPVARKRAARAHKVKA